MKTMRLTTLLATLLLSGAALAHDDAYLDSLQAPHGGQLRMAGPYHYELVVAKDQPEPREQPVVVYVTDHGGTPVSSAGASGSVTLLSGKHKATATLQPDGENRLRGTASYAATPDLKAIVSITLPDQQAGQARFTPLAAKVAASQGHTQH